MKNFNIREDRWITSTPLTKKQREMIFMLAECIGIRVAHVTRNFTNGDEYPYLQMYDREISGRRGATHNSVTAIVEYEYVIEELSKIIRNKSEFKCF